MADKIGYLFLFVSLVAVILVLGVLVGMLVAGRIDRLMTPRAANRQDGDAASAAPAASQPATASQPPPTASQPATEDVKA